MISFSWQSVAKTVIYLNFKKNQKELAVTVCENKSKPKSCCEAKCYLEKEIKKEDKRQSDSQTSGKDKTEKTELRTGLTLFNFQPQVISVLKSNTLQLHLPDCFIPSVFHPPAR